MGAKRTAAKKPLPLVGPITYYLPTKDGCPCTDGLAERLGVSVANVHNQIVVVYEKLHISTNRDIPFSGVFR